MGRIHYDEDGRNPVFFVNNECLLKDSNYEFLNCQNVNGI